MDLSNSWLVVCGAVATVLAVIAWIADHRRSKRRHLEQVGFMPWTGLFFWSVLAAVLLLGAALKTYMAV